MKKIFYAALCMLAVGTAQAQETYEIADLSTQDLNGTARYVGMGGALEALGADISTISTNPAGIGLFRKSQLTGSLGLVSQNDEQGFASANKTNLSFDQLGFVWANQMSPTSYVNFAVNYHKSRNFNQLLSVADRLGGASQSKLTLDKFDWGVVLNDQDLTYSHVDALYHSAFYCDNSSGTEQSILFDANGDYIPGAGYRFGGSDYLYHRGNNGYVSQFDFNLSGNINNRVYLGASLGLYNVNFHGHTVYAENLMGNIHNVSDVELEDKREIEGTGVDVKLGAIFCPVEESPFRIGVYLNSPTFYSMESSNKTVLRWKVNGTPDYEGVNSSFKYEYRTPWKFGLSAGHTIDNYLAFGATYEYADYSTSDARIKDASYDSYYDTYSSESDDKMNAHIKQTLKGVSTFKVGVEYRPDKDLAIRMGYNYVSPMYKKDASRGVDVWSIANCESSSTEYINWKDTHRLTVGLGFNLGSGFKLDAAYQFSTQKGQFLPFAGGADDNLPYDKEVKFARNQWMMTLTYAL
jgi:long-subunit fatty acid transport protein